jgi:hypothetical protein
VEVPLRSKHPLAQLKLDIVRHRDLAVRLARKGDVRGAREVRAKLFNLEDRLEVLEEMMRPFRDA